MKNPISRKDNIVVRKMAGETLVYDLIENKAFCLNKTSARVWELCDGERTAKAISDQLSGELKTPVSEEIVWLGLEQLGRDGLLESADYFSGLSRRELISKVGFSSMVALPLVASVAAPTASSAQSLGNIGSTCTTDPNCASSNCMPVIPGGGMSCCATGVPGNQFGSAISNGTLVVSAAGTNCHPDISSCNAIAATACCSGAANYSVNNCGGMTGSGTCRCT